MKMRIVAVLIQLIAISGIAAENLENPLGVWAKLNQKPKAHPSISLSSYFKGSRAKPLLAFKLTNLSRKPLTLQPSALPWGNPHSITLAAITTDGQCIQNHYPIADPPVQKEITVAPNASLEGDYDLGLITSLSTAPKDRDIAVIWSYRIPGNWSKEEPICTGVIVIPKE